MAVIGDIQSLLLTFMCSIANSCFAKNSYGLGSVPESIEQTERCYFVDAAIAFYKLHQLLFNISIKTKVRYAPVTLNFVFHYLIATSNFFLLECAF